LAAASDWTINSYETENGERPAGLFLRSLGPQDSIDAASLLKSLREQGNALRRPNSASLGDGLFELRGKQVRIFYIFLPGRMALLLDGEIKKRNDIPTATMKRMRKLQKDALAEYGRRHRPRR
jgi:hypothetical protein